ncbi:MAG: Secretion system C-terminal sorting domain [Bacteroidota bacterium]|jgi:hypothetical protein
MKKLYVLLACVLGLSFQLAAQSVAPASGLKLIEDPIKPLQVVKPTHNLKNKATETSWLSPVTNWQDQGAFFQSSSFFRLFPDTGVVIVPSDGSGAFHQSFALMGTVMQPDQPFYELQAGWLMNRYDNYTVDSVRFSMGYFRNVDSMDAAGSMVEVVDTVVVHYYESEDLGTWTLNSTGERFAIPDVDDYSVALCGPKSVKFTDTLLLDATAATPVGSDGTFQPLLVRSAIPAGINESGPDPLRNGSNRVGVSVVYKPMQKFSFGDTLVSFDPNAENVKKLNNFGVISYANGGSAMTQTEFLNNSFVTNSQVRYGQTFGPLKGYLATMAFFGWTRDFFFDADFLVTVENPASVASVQDNLGLIAYPNPAKKGQEILVSVDENVALNNVKIKMTDLLGNVITSDYTVVGGNEFAIPTNGLAGGVYLITVNAENAASTIRVVVAQ